MIAPLVMATMLWAPQAVLLLEPPLRLQRLAVAKSTVTTMAVVAAAGAPAGTAFDVSASCRGEVNGDLDATGCPPAGALFSGSDGVNLNCTCFGGSAGGIL